MCNRITLFAIKAFGATSLRQLIKMGIEEAGAVNRELDINKYFTVCSRVS
jgi:hypothetical protein